VACGGSGAKAPALAARPVCPVTVDPPTFCLVAIFKVESKELELELELDTFRILIRAVPKILQGICQGPTLAFFHKWNLTSQLDKLRLSS